METPKTKSGGPESGEPGDESPPLGHAKSGSAVLDRAAGVFSLAAAVFLVFMMLFTTASVILRYFANWTGENDVDIMIWAFAACIFIGLPAVTLRDEHVAVDLIDFMAPKRLIRILRWIGLLFVIVFLAISFYKAFPVALEKLEFGENSMSLDINKFWFWLPMLIGLACATLAAVAVGLSWIRGGPPESGGSSDPL